MLDFEEVIRLVVNVGGGMASTVGGSTEAVKAVVSVGASTALKVCPGDEVAEAVMRRLGSVPQWVFIAFGIA